MLWYFNKHSVSELLEKSQIIVGVYSTIKVKQPDGSWYVSTVWGDFVRSNVEMKHAVLQYYNQYTFYDADENQLDLKLFGGVKCIKV